MQIGIVGTGYIANYHVEILKKIHGVRVAACCDADVGRAREFARRWNISKACASPEELAETEGLQLVHVLVPPSHHYAVAKALLQRGIGVFLEKPMAETAEECRELVELAKETGAIVAVNQNSIFHPAFIRLKRDIASGFIGKVHQVVSFQSGPLGQLDAGMFSHWMFRKPGNVLLEQGPHPVAQVRELIGNALEVVPLVSGQRTLGAGQIFFDRWQASVQCRRGHALMHLSFGRRYFLESRLEVSGEDGCIRVDFLKNLYLVQKKSVFPDYLDPAANAFRYAPVAMQGLVNFADYAFSKLGVRGKRDPFYLSMQKSIESFYRSLQSGDSPHVTGMDGLEIVEWCEKWIDRAGVNEKVPQAAVSRVVASRSRPEILITGATGFIGRNLLAYFVRRGVPVRAMVRSEQGLPEVFSNPMVEVFKGTLEDPRALRRAVSGIRVLYHLAHSIGRTWEEFRRVNVDGTLGLAEAAKTEGVRYFVFTSTIAVYCYADVPGGRVDESTPIDSKPEKRNLYARSKIHLEHLLLEQHRSHGLPLVLFRPGIVVGQGGSPYHSGVGQWSRDNVCAYWGDGRNALPFVLVEDVCDALARVVEIEGLEGEVFNLVGDVRLSAREYVRHLRRISNRNITAFPYPMNLCFASECFKTAIKALTGAHKDSLLSYRDLANRSILAAFDNRKAKEKLGWQPCAEPDLFANKALGWAF
ncbi:MAG: NAD-dependent epimerase/dehydratase family protein [Deltaproteobacteria bacterium]|nr:NAD-dependent epimerase/dehydratase family protein [Deltaproteobacteria bacterium]